MPERAAAHRPGDPSPDRILQLTETVADRDMRDQLLDSTDLERELGCIVVSARRAW